MDLGTAHAMARQLLALHGLDDWRVEFDRAKRRAGVCRHRSRLIGLSAALTRVHDEAEVRETVLHEVAHALAGPEHQHDAVWRSVAVSIGSNGERCVSEDAPRVVGGWLGVCAAGHESDRHRRPERVLLCRACAGRGLDERVFQWTYRGSPASMHPNYEAELQALRQGGSAVQLSTSERVMIRSSGEFDGRIGVIEKVGRTRYHVRLPEGVVRVLFAAAQPVKTDQSPQGQGADLTRKQTQVSMSLLLPDGRIHVQGPDGDVVELLAGDPVGLRRLLVSAILPTWPSADEPRLLRHQAYVVGARRELALRPMTSMDIPGDAPEFSVLTCRSEWGDGDWTDVDDFIGALFRTADQRDCHLLLQSRDSSLNLRLERREEHVFVVSDREITAHEVWRRAVARSGRFVLQGSFSETAYATAGQLAMIAFGSEGFNPLEVYPSFVRKVS